MTVELTEPEAVLFRLLSQAGAWNIKSGSATIHFNEYGCPTTIETRQFTSLKELSTPQDSGLAIRVVL